MKSNNRTWLKWLAAGFAVVVFVWFVPLVEFVPLEKTRADSQNAQFHAARFAQEFWETRLSGAHDSAVDATSLVAMLRGNATSARTQFGRTVGLSRVSLFHLRGRGKVLAVTDDGVTVSLIPPDDVADIELATGPLFGNTVRDASGLLDASEFANSQDFNDISNELNGIIEAQVQPQVRELQAGNHVEFVGCAELSADSHSNSKLQVVPLSIDVVE